MLKPLGNRVLLELIEEETKTSGGIVLPDSAKEKPRYAKVVALGKGTLSENGERLPMEVSVGDKVVFEKYAGTEINDEGNDYLILNETDIIAIAE